MKKSSLVLVAVLGLAAVASPAFAAIDTTGSMASITDATSACVTVLGGMITFAGTLFGLRKIMGVIKRG